MEEISSKNPGETEPFFTRVFGPFCRFLSSRFYKKSILELSYWYSVFFWILNKISKIEKFSVCHFLLFVYDWNIMIFTQF